VDFSVMEKNKKW